ncbi:hypothetical protein C7379_12439 [Hallella colorans]|uniref:Uncharacterized protein n=1 Tax=Hallella colorans TaxID=1703337 RepID=A0A2U0TYX7_9BACT|nr:hypothetical protein C7379_12439 [Hallella colorans]
MHTSLRSVVRKARPDVRMKNQMSFHIPYGSIICIRLNGYDLSKPMGLHPSTEHSVYFYKDRYYLYEMQATASI